MRGSALISFLLCLSVLAGCGESPGAGPGSLRVSGLVTTDAIRVAPSLAGKIARLEAREGDTVAAGQLMAVLDTTHLDARLERQRALVRQLRAQFEQQRKLQQAWAEEQVRLIHEQEADGRERIAKLPVATGPRRRVEAGVVVEEPQPASEGLRRDLAEYRLWLLRDRAAEAQSRVELLKAGTNSGAVLKQEEARLADLEEQRAQTEIRAPHAGTVSLCAVSDGEIVRAGEPIYALFDPDQLYARFDVEETRLPHLPAGRELAVELPSGETITGRIGSILPEAGFATSRDVSRVRRDIRTFAIQVRLPDPQRRLRPGVTVYVRIPAVTGN